MISRRAQELQETVNMARGLPRSPARKRGGEKDTISTYSPSKKTRKSTKKKYPLLGDDWGLVETSETPPKTSQPPPMDGSQHHQPWIHTPPTQAITSPPQLGGVTVLDHDPPIQPTSGRSTTPPPGQDSIF